MKIIIFQQAIESETSKSSEVLRERFEVLRDKAKKVIILFFIF